MTYESFWTFMTETQVFGVDLASLAGKTILVIVMWCIARTIEHAVVRVTNKVLTKAKVPSSSILINIMRGFIWLIAAMTVIEPVFGVKPTAFLTALGAGSLALSLGLQDTVSNIVGGLSLMTGKVIEPGDVVKIGDFTGVVTDIGWRSTCVSDQYGQVNVLPNSVLYKQSLVKLSDFTEGRFTVQVVIEHGSNLEEVREDVDRLCREVLGDWYDAENGVQLMVQIVDIGGMITQIAVHVVHGVLFDEARTRLAGAISKRPWSKKP